MKRILIALIALLVLFCISLTLVSAQRLVSPASAPHPVECPPVINCPFTPSPVPHTNGQGAHPGDEDGDGIPDGIDQCPNEGGPSSNQGCPAGRSITTGTGATVGLVTPALPITLLPTLPATGNCVLATKTNEPVNVHLQPALSAKVVGTLDPAVTYLVISALQTPQGLWYDVIPGWVSKTAVRLSAPCAHIPVWKTPDVTDHNPLPLTRADGFGLTLDKGSSPGQDSDHGYCSSSFSLDFAKLDGSGNAAQIAFGDGSVQPAPACIKIDNDGQGFGLVSPGPCDIGQVALACPPVTIHGALGLVGDQLTLVFSFEPVPSNGEPPPDPDKVGVFLSWMLAPPDPCAQGDQSCKAQGGARDFKIDWSDARADIPGVAFAWEFLPPPCAPGDQSCAAPIAGKQGAIINFLPAVQNSALSAVQTVVVNWFVNGFDPSVGGFTQIEHQGDDPQPGDKYGFTQIESLPFSSISTVQFEPPAVQ